MNKIQIIIPYTSRGINGKDFETFIKGLNMLIYPVYFTVVGEFPLDIQKKYVFIDEWVYCKESEIPETIKTIKIDFR